MREAGLYMRRNRSASHRNATSRTFIIVTKALNLPQLLP